MIAQSYSHVDTVVDTYPKSFQSIEAFGDRIQKDFTEDADKVRAAYYWIATHITYDYKSLETGKNDYPTIEITDYKDQQDYRAQYLKIYASHVLNYKTGICAGYARLLFHVCEYMSIKATVISGNARTSVNEIGIIPKNTNHAWNAVFFNDKWNLIDATWSTGNERGKPNYFDFEDSYFCIPPERMILSHFPKDVKWQLLKKKVSKKYFFEQPLISNEYLALNIVLDSRIKGTIKGKTNGFITLRFKQIDTTQQYHYTFVRDKYATEMIINKTKGYFIAKIPFKGYKKDRLRIFSKSSIVTFRIIPTR